MGTSYRTAAKLAHMDLDEIRAREARDPVMQALTAIHDRLDHAHRVSARARCPGCGACQEYASVRAALTHRKRELREGRLG